MGKYKLFIVCAAAVLLLPLCSCTGYTELENMDILTSHFVCKSDDDILLGGGVANVRSLSDSMADNPVNYIGARAPTLPGAIQSLRMSADHTLFYGGMRAVVIGESYAREGCGEFFDYISTLPDCRSSVNVFTSSSDPRLIVGFKAVNDFSGGFAAESIVHTLGGEEMMTGCTLSDIWEARAYRQVGFAVPDIEINDDVMSVSGYSIFNHDRKIGSLGAAKGTSLNYITGKSAKGSYNIAVSRESMYAVKTDMKKRYIDVYESGGTLHADISLLFDITVTPPKSGTAAEGSTEYIKSRTEEIISDEVNEIFDAAKQYGCDFLKLHKSYQRKNRSKFDTLDWQSMISDMDFSVQVSTDKVKIISAR